MSRLGSYHGSGVTVRYNFGTTGEKILIYYALFLCIYFEQTLVQIHFYFFHLDVNILNIITFICIYICEKVKQILAIYFKKLNFHIF